MPMISDLDFVRKLFQRAGVLRDEKNKRKFWQLAKKVGLFLQSEDKKEWQ